MQKLVYTCNYRAFRKKGVVTLSGQSFLKLYYSNCYVNIWSCIFQTFKDKNSFSCMNAPKRTDSLVYYRDCSATYHMKDGTVFNVSKGDIVYTPKGSCYSLEIYNREHANAGSFGIHFLLYDENMLPTVASDEAFVINSSDPEHYYSLFSKMSKIYDAGVKSNSRIKELFYEIVSSICEAYEYKNIANNEFRIIEKGISYLETDYKLEKSVADIAEMCMVSENYFRRLFKEYSGVSPKEYILNAKIQKAKSRLFEENIPISEIADICGFPDTAYFCRVFKKRTGFSPLEYRKAKNNGKNI